ncbi:type VI secretion system membrane subunit TssM [Vibrio harveyi]
MTQDNPNTPTRKKAIIWSLVTLLLLAILGGLLTWFVAYPDFLWIGVITTTIVALLSAGLCFWLINRKVKKSLEQDQERALIIKRSKLLAFHFKKMLGVQKRKKRLTSRYDQPIYLLLSDNLGKDKSIITQMGYEAYKVDDFGNDIEFPILFWLSEHSILISVSMGDDQQPLYLKTLCQCLNKWRPRQAINGLLLTTEIEQLVGNSETLSQKADQLKSQIKAFNRSFGLNLPVYNVLTNMGQVSDFCQFFSAFDEARRNEVFGATSPVQKHGGIDADWFNDEYDHLIGQLISNMSNALGAQLNQDFRNAICGAPYQFGLLKQNLWHFLQRLHRGDQYTDGLNFRGFYFTHSGSDFAQHDLLANVVNQSLGNEQYQQHQQMPVQQTLFAQNLMSHVVLNENTLVGVNRHKENWLWFSQTAYTLIWLGLLIGTLTILKLDFDYQTNREAKADGMLERYKEAIAAQPYSKEDLVGNIPNLYTIHRIYALYQEPEPWYTLPFLPNATIKPEVEAAYTKELQQVLLPSMAHTIENDLYVYVNLEDQARTLELLNDYRLLFDKNRTNIEELKSYFLANLEHQGEADKTNVAQLKVLLDDVFNQHLVATTANQELEGLAKQVINQSNIETLLYQHILNDHAYEKRIDVRKELGSNFNQIYQFKPGYVGYFVPYLYTPTGFNELDLSVESPLLIEALSAYEGIAGQAPSALEMHRISHDLKRMYQNDYINYWRDFINSIEVKTISGSEQLNASLNVLNNASNNPMSKLFTTISNYTSVLLPEPKDAKKKTDEEIADAAQDNEKKESARQITLTFNDFHKQVTPDEQGKKPIDSVLEGFANTAKWLDQFYKSNTPDKVAYETLSAGLKAQNPVAQLASLTDSQPPLSGEVIDYVTVQTNELVMNLAHQYLNSMWNSEVYQPYENTIAAFYPFKKSANSDASTADVAAFFKTDGTLDTFYQTMLKGFSTEQRAPFMSGLLPNTGFALDPAIWLMFDKAKDIRSALFLADPKNVAIQFQMKPTEMSSALTEFSIRAEKPIFTYQHGPMLWTQQSWKGDSVAQDALTVRLQKQATPIANEQFKGSWAWFRLIEPRVTSTSSQSTQLEFDYNGDKVRLTIKTQGQNNPFVPNFFAGFVLPASI